MYLKLAHTRMWLYADILSLIKVTYSTAKHFPAYEQYALCTQMRRSATSILLNYSEGSSKASAAYRARYYEMSRASLVELDSILEIAFLLGYVSRENPELEQTILSCFKGLSRLISSTKHQKS